VISSGPHWELRLGRWQDALSDVDTVDAIVCDPPYGSRTHSVQLDLNVDTGITAGLTPQYTAWIADDVHEFVQAWSARCTGWMFAMTSHDLIPVWEAAYARVDRYCFAPLPCVMNGMTVRMAGDGPSSWAVYGIAARPKTQEMARWGSLRGAYTGPRGNEAGGGRGKPDWLMSAIVNDYSRAGDLVCDPFAGWGSTLTAALSLHRRAIGSECDREAFTEATRRLGRPLQLSMLETM
jgi:DNA methylase